MYDYHVSSRYEMIDIGNGQWIFDVGGKLFHGTFKEVVSMAVKRYGFEFEEIETAVEYMIKLDHNAAHFGVNRYFLFSFFKEINFEKKAG